MQKPLDILIVDDHPPNLLALQATLEPLAEHLVEAHSGREALAAFEHQSFALVLLDVRMPDLDGFAVAQLIRQHEHGRETPIIFLTAATPRPEDARRGLALGAVDYINKPYDPILLCCKVESFLTLHREREARRNLENAVRMKDLILGVIGHDLLGPLTAIQSSVHLARSPSADRTGALNRVELSVRRMNRMLAALLDYAQTQNGGRMPVTPADTHMDELCREAMDEGIFLHPDRDFHLAVSGDVSGRWDGERVSQALANLVSNALKHSDSDVWVEVDGQDPAEVVVSVESEGQPFPESVRAALFSPFQKGDAGRRGFGLGLFIVREIASAHSATVELVSAPGERRTRFVTRWPRRA